MTHQPLRTFAAICIGLTALTVLSGQSEAKTQSVGLLQLAMMDDMKMPAAGMRAMEKQSGEMPMGSGQMSGAMGGGGMGCCMGAMGQSPGAGMGMNMATSSALPGFPGASHLYHIGATGFFLDHADKVNINAAQQTKLNGIKQQALKEQADRQRQIDAMEEELWFLTAAEQPDLPSIETKLREAEKAKTDQRIAFIRSVGEAASVLNPEQHKLLLGKVPMPAAKTPAK